MQYRVLKYPMPTAICCECECLIAKTLIVQLCLMYSYQIKLQKNQVEQGRVVCHSLVPYDW